MHLPCVEKIAKTASLQLLAWGCLSMGGRPENPRWEMLSLVSCLKDVGELFPSPQLTTPFIIVAQQHETTWVWHRTFAVRLTDWKKIIALVCFCSRGQDFLNISIYLSKMRAVFLGYARACKIKGVIRRKSVIR